MDIEKLIKEAVKEAVKESAYWEDQPIEVQEEPHESYVERLEKWRTDNPEKYVSEPEREREFLEATYPEGFLKPEWCECGDPSEDGPYPDDDECPCGVGKHHVHCLNCGGITQTG